MLILGIETSCDETAVAVLDIKHSKDRNSQWLSGVNHWRVLSNTVSTQVKLRKKYGGVVPYLAAREHSKSISRVLKKSLKDAGIKSMQKEIGLIAVTRGPGLGPALIVGIKFANKLAERYKIPLVGVDHLEGHILSNWLKPIGEFSIFNQLADGRFSKKNFPILNLIVSGAHTELVLMRAYGKYQIIGQTLDDAVGEAFDKVARLLLNLGYPGGPAIAKRASQWNDKFPITNFQLKIDNHLPKIIFPMPMANSKNYNFSYSGLKTAILYKVRDLVHSSKLTFGNAQKNKFKRKQSANSFDIYEQVKISLDEKIINEICHAFQKSAIDILVTKTIRAAKEFAVKSIMLSGGVSANNLLRTDLKKTKENNLKFSRPEMEYTSDNAAMIALAGYFNYKTKKQKTGTKPVAVDANLNLN